MHQRMLASYGVATPFVVDAADFDGTNDRLFRAAPSGIANSKSGTVSVWSRVDTSQSNMFMRFWINGSLTGFFFRNNFGNVQVSGADAGNTVVLLLQSTPSSFGTGSWNHMLASWDLAAGVAHLYVNDVDVKAAGATITNATIPWASFTQYEVGGEAAAVSYDGGIAELYFAPGQYIDLSVTNNRRLFINPSLKPANLGATGSSPTGSAPSIYLHLADAEAPANFATNRTGNGNFTITGTLTTYASSPSD